MPKVLALMTRWCVPALHDSGNEKHSEGTRHFLLGLSMRHTFCPSKFHVRSFLKVYVFYDERIISGSLGLERMA